MSAQRTSPKRPRLSLQTQSVSPAPNVRKSSRVLAAVVDPRDPTAFNTLSNVYVTAIERSTPTTVEPLTAINTKRSYSIESQSVAREVQHRMQTPYTAFYPETPLSANPLSPNAPMAPMEVSFPSAMTATPPLSASLVEKGMSPFTFAAGDTSIFLQANAASSPRSARRRINCSSGSSLKPPYTHPRALHSILRNSPLPPSTARTPISPRRQSLRLQERAARRVGYNNPLTQTITTNRYTKSHIDLLVEDTSPCSPVGHAADAETVLGIAMAYTGNETRDGGQTPGPFEEMRRRMAGLGAAGMPLSPSGGIRKRKRRDKKRRWVWTIGQEDEDDSEVGGAVAAVRAAEAASASSTPLSTASQTAEEGPSVLREGPSVLRKEPADDASQEMSQGPGLEPADVTMSDSSSFVTDERAGTPEDVDVTIASPMVMRKCFEPQAQPNIMSLRLASICPVETGSRHHTPVPPELMAS